MTEPFDIAVSALEVVIRGIFDCQRTDVVKILAEQQDNGEIAVHGVVIERDGKPVRFMNQQAIPMDDKLVALGSYFIGAAKNFLVETLDPALRGSRMSVARLSAFAKEVNLDDEFADEGSRLEAQQRLGRE